MSARADPCIGTGYLGATHAAAMAELGFEVLGIDVDATKVRALAAGEVPFYEPGLPELLRKDVDSRAAAVHHVLRGGRGLRRRPLRLRRHAAAAGQQRRGPDARSTRPSARSRRCCTRPGAGRRQVDRAGRAPRSGWPRWSPRSRRRRRRRAGLEPGVPPRGLRGRGHPAPGPARVRGRLGAGPRRRCGEVYAPMIDGGCPFVVTDFATAELVKVAANSFLATKISFINAMAEVCEVDRRGRDASWPRRSATTTGSARGSCTPGSASAAAACPRTSARSWPAPASWARGRR